MFKSFFLKLLRVLLVTNVKYSEKALIWRWTVLSVTIIYSLHWKYLVMKSYPTQTWGIKCWRKFYATVLFHNNFKVHLKQTLKISGAKDHIRDFFKNTRTEITNTTLREYNQMPQFFVECLAPSKHCT